MDELKSTAAGMQLERKPVNRRLVMAGFAGAGAAALLGAKLTGVQAQESDDGDDHQSDGTMDPEVEAKLLALYDTFLASASAELGVADTARIDLAIRNGMKAVVDQRFADGEISANAADARKAAIEEAVVPFGIGARIRAARRRDRRNRRPWNDPDEESSDDVTSAI